MTPQEYVDHCRPSFVPPDEWASQRTEQVACRLAGATYDYVASLASCDADAIASRAKMCVHLAIHLCAQMPDKASKRALSAMVAELSAHRFLTCDRSSMGRLYLLSHVCSLCRIPGWPAHRTADCYVQSAYFYAKSLMAVLPHEIAIESVLAGSFPPEVSE
jgi:ribosomal protein S15P/S13E